MIGHKLQEIIREPIYYGADRVIYVDNEMCKEYNPETFTKILTKIIKKYRPEIFLVPGTKYGRELAPSCNSL